MTTRIAPYSQKELFNLLASDRDCFVINGDDIDMVLHKKETRDIEFIHYYQGNEFLYYNHHMTKVERIYCGASIYKVIPNI